MNILSKNQSNILKLIGIILMLVDHVGLLFFPEIIELRLIGRIVFPIFAYQIGIGYLKTFNLSKYIRRLFFFAVISQPFYVFFNRDLEFNPFSLNIIFSLLLGILTIHFYKKIKLLWNKSRILYLFALPIFFLAILLLPEFLVLYFGDLVELSFLSYGILMILLFYIFREKILYMFFSHFLISILLIYFSTVKFIYLNYYNIGLIEAFYSFTKMFENLQFGLFLFQFTSFLFFPVLYFVRKIKINFTLPKNIFYIFYPLHIAILILIKFLI